MENQKIINLLNKIDTNSRHFATKKWYIINDENNTNYGVNKDTGANNPDTIKNDTRVLKPSLCDYADAYILVDGTIRAETQILPAPAPNIANVKLALKNCAPFTKCNLEINDEHVDTAENLDITMPMYNLIEYSDNYQDSSATLYQYKRDEPSDDIADNLGQDNSTSFNYKKEKEYTLSKKNGNAVFIINDTKLYVPVVTLSKEDNKDFIEQQNKGFQRSIYWNEYKTKEQEEAGNANATKYINLDPSFQGVNR